MRLSYFPPRLALVILLCLSQSASSEILRYTCYAHLEGADHNRDSKLNREEFTQAVNRMGQTKDAFQVNSFMELPDAIQDAFNRLSCRCLGLSNDDGLQPVSCCGGEYATVDIAGITPGTRPTQVEQERLDEACEVIEQSLAEAKLSNQGFRFKSLDVSADFSFARQATKAPIPISLPTCFISMTVVVGL